MHKHVLVALFVCVGGIVASLFVLPNAQDYERLQAADMEMVDSGKVNLEAEYAQGRRSLPIISGLVDKKNAEDDKAAATALLEDYVTANPRDLKGHAKLAEQYKLTGKPAEYAKQLGVIESLARESGSSSAHPSEKKI